MFCSNCGAFAGMNNFCENCGSKVTDNIENTGILTITRPNRFVGVAVGIEIYIDNKSYTNIKNNSKIELRLPEGKHTISYKVWCRSLKTIELNIIRGNNYELIFTPDYILGGFKINKNSRL